VSHSRAVASRSHRAAGQHRRTAWTIARTRTGVRTPRSMSDLKDDAAGHWLTYTEAAERLNLSAEAVRQRARRQSWRKQSGNDGRALVYVPLDIEAEQPPEHTAERPDTGGQPSGVQPAVQTATDQGLVRTLDQAIAIISEQLGRANVRADQNAAMLRDALTHAEHAWAATRTAQAAAQEAEGRAAALEAADAARRAKGRLARLRAAWRGE